MPRALAAQSPCTGQTRHDGRRGVRVEQLRAWNGIRGDVLRVGQELAVEEAQPEDGPAAPADRAVTETSRSESVGSPSRGAIEGGEPLGEHPGFVLRDASRSYATRRTVARIHAAFDAVRRADPHGPRVRVHDLSLAGGGPINGHLSHQSGRDVDITYYQRRGCGADGCPVRTVRPGGLDARRTWRLLRHWLERGQARAIFVDYSLQEPLLREARRTGVTAAQIDAWFQFPRGPSRDEGVVRHFPNHVDHFHVRFACHRSETRCE